MTLIDKDISIFLLFNSSQITRRKYWLKWSLEVLVNMLEG